MKDQHNQLTALKDQEALSKLADGHTEEFLTYAQQRVGSAESDAERKYWQGLITKAQGKIEDDNLSAEVAAGTKSLEDLARHINLKMVALPGGQSNPNYPTYLKQLSDVKNSIAARDFRNEMLTAQQAYINNPDKLQAKKDYATVLTNMLYRAKDPTAQDAILKQLDTVKQGIANDEQQAREQELAKNVTLYHDQKITFSELMDVLTKQANDPKTTPAEAQRLASLASQAETNERARNSAAVSAASRNGQTAIDQALFSPKESYLNAKQRLANELDRGAPTVETVNAFKTAASLYDEALRKSAPNATSLTHLETMLTDMRGVSNDGSNLTRQAATAVVDDALKKGVNYQGLVDAAKSGNEKDSASAAEAVSQARFQWAQSLRDASSSPILEGNDKEKARLTAALATITNAQRTDIAREAGYLGGQNQTSGQKKYDALYQSYLEAGGTSPREEWLNGADGMGGQGTVDGYENMSAPEADAERARLSAILAKGTDPMARNQLATLDAAQQHAGEVADRAGALAAYTAPRGADGSTVASPSNLYAPGGPLDESTRANAMASYRLPAPSAGPLVMGRGASATSGLVSEQPGGASASMEAPPAGPWNARDFLPNDPYTRLLEAHIAGNNALDSGGSSVGLPQWEIPGLPSEPAFSSGGSMAAFDMGNFEPPPLSIPGGSGWNAALPPPPFGALGAGGGSSSGSGTEPTLSA